MAGTPEPTRPAPPRLAPPALQEQGPVDFTKEMLDRIWAKASPAVIMLKKENPPTYHTGFIISSTSEESTIAFDISVLDGCVAGTIYYSSEEGQRGVPVSLSTAVTVLMGGKYILMRASSRGIKRQAVTFGDDDPKVECQRIASIVTNGVSLSFYKGHINLHSCETSLPQNPEINHTGKDVFALTCPFADDYVLDPPDTSTRVLTEAQQKELEENARSVAECRRKFFAMMKGAPVFDTDGYLVGMLESCSLGSHTVKFARKSKCFVKDYEESLREAPLQLKTM